MKQVLPALTVALMLGAATITPALAQDDTSKDAVTTEDTAKSPDTMTKKEARAEAATIEVPENAVTVATYYNETVYDRDDNKIGNVNDLLLDTDGQIQAVIVGVGGFLGIGAKDVAVPFESLEVAEKDGDTYLVMDATKETLEKATGYVYDDSARQWKPAKQRS